MALTLEELICPQCAAMNRPGALIIQVDDPITPGSRLVVCGVCRHAWCPAPPYMAGNSRRGPPDRRVRERRSNWTAATGRDADREA